MYLYKYEMYNNKMIVVICVVYLCATNVFVIIISVVTRDDTERNINNKTKCSIGIDEVVFGIFGVQKQPVVLGVKNSTF